MRRKKTHICVFENAYYALKDRKLPARIFLISGSIFQAKKGKNNPRELPGALEIIVACKKVSKNSKINEIKIV